MKEPQRSSEVVAGPSNSQSNSSETSKISFKERKHNFQSAHRNQGGLKKIPPNIVKLKKTNLQFPKVLPVLKKKRRRPMKDALEKSGRLSPRQKFAVFKPPAVSQPPATMHPTQKETEMKEYQPESGQPILKVQVEKLAPENGVNGKTGELEPVVPIENEAKVENNGHNHHDIIDHEEEIVDVVTLSEAEVPVIQEAEEAPAYDDIGNGVPEEPLLLSPRLRGSAKKGPSSSRSSSPADSLHKERTPRKPSYVQPVVEVHVEEKLEVSMVADLDEPLIVEGGTEDLEVSAAVPAAVEKSPAKSRAPIKAASPSRSKKMPKVPSTPIEEVTGRRSRKPRSDEKKPPVEDASPRASMSLMEGVDDHKPLSGRAGSAIRSVRARRPMRRSRNISALDSSLHNQSSPWDEEYNVLSPRGGGESLVDSSLVNGDQSLLSVSTSHKRKVSEDELDTKEVKKAKNDSSHTSSFFSIVTSPICALKEKFRGGALSSSTPFHGVQRKTVDTDASMMSAEENGEEEEFAEDAKTSSPPVATPEVPAKSWCLLM